MPSISTGVFRLKPGYGLNRASQLKDVRSEFFLVDSAGIHVMIELGMLLNKELLL